MRKIERKKNKRGQLDNPIIIFAFLIIGLLILAPVMMKIFITMRAGFGAGLGNVTSGGAIGQTNFLVVMNTAVNFWDKIMVAMFVISIITLFVSAFLIDAHPFFVILYIVTCFLLIIFAPNIVQVADKIYESSTFTTEVASLTFMNALRTHYAEFLIGIIIITGIIIYGKIAFFRSQNGGNTRR